MYDATIKSYESYVNSGPGSVYNDQALMESLPGEFTCNNRVAVIKVISGLRNSGMK